MKFQLVDRSFHFPHGTFGRMWSKGGKSGKGVRVATNKVGQSIVGRGGKFVSGIGIEHLYSGYGEREQMHVHSALVHNAQPFLGIQEATPKFIPHGSGFGTIEDALHKRYVEVRAGCRAN